MSTINNNNGNILINGKNLRADQKALLKFNGIGDDYWTKSHAFWFKDGKPSTEDGYLYPVANPTQTEAKTLAQVNAAIAKEFPKVILVRGEGYFYIASDDNEVGIFLAGLYTTSIPVAKLSQQSVEVWVNDVRNLMAQPD